jgi:hypothetical protein
MSQMSGPVKRLEDFYKVLKPGPLLTSEELKLYYQASINRLRGTDIVARLTLALSRCYGAAPLKALVMGHSGVGKSTELTRLIVDNAKKFRAIRCSITQQLDPTSFAAFDVLLLMMAELAEATARPIEQGGAGQSPSESTLREIWNWFGTEKETLTRATQTGVEMSAGAGVPAESLWAKALGLFASLKGEFKYSSVRQKETVAYRLSRLDTLIAAANHLVQECNKLLRKATGCEWLFIVEDADKAGVSRDSVMNFFVNYSNILRNLDAHWIFTIPIALGYSPSAGSLPAQQDMIMCVPDTMVFNPNHKPHSKGRAALCDVLSARVDSALFEPNQTERLVVASGGNLRDLFTLSCNAADNAIIETVARIASRHVDLAIAALRNDYERRLGEGPYDTELWAGGVKDLITYHNKVELLLRIYKQEPTARIANPVLFSLLHARAVQEFNGERWFGVHPLVVDILGMQGKIGGRKRVRVPGGSE